SGDSGADTAHNPGTVSGQSRGAGKVATVRIESGLVHGLKRANEIGNGILREDEAAVHIVAGVEQNENIGPGEGCIEALGRIARWITRLRRCVSRVRVGLFRDVGQGAGGSVAFLKSGNFLGDAVFGDGEVRGAKIRDVVAPAIGHGDIQLDEVDDYVQATSALALPRNHRSPETREECSQDCQGNY